MHKQDNPDPPAQSQRLPPKRVLLLLPEAFGHSGGIQMFCRALCLAAGRWAQSQGASVSAVVLNDRVVPDGRYVNGGFSHYVAAGKSKTKFIREYLRRIISARYDVVVFGHISLSPLALLVRLLNPGVKTCVVTYGIEVWRPLSKAQRLALRRADVVLAISDHTKDELIKHSALAPERIRVFPCTLDPHWKATPPSGDAARWAPPVVLTVTRMSKEDRYKGIDSVIRSLPAVTREVGPVEYRVVGQGDDVPRLKALAAGLGVGRYVKFMGGLDDAALREQYRSCSLFVMPSRKEGFGIVFLEAMAYGKPVIGGAHGGTPSVVKDGETGLLVDNSNVPALARAITRLLSDEALRERFGGAGHRRLLDEFTFDRFQQNLQEVFRSLEDPDARRTASATLSS